MKTVQFIKNNISSVSTCRISLHARKEGKRRMVRRGAEKKGDGCDLMTETLFLVIALDVCKIPELAIE